MRTLVLGMGNPILCDDGIGFYVVRAFNNTVHGPDVTVDETNVAGLDILDILVNWDRVIIVDAIQTAGGRPGAIYRLEPEALATTRHGASPHDVNFAMALEFGRRLNLPLPPQIVVFAIEARDVVNFSEKCTPEVERAIPLCVELIRREIYGDITGSIAASAVNRRSSL